jgi:hypothetical protein
MIDEEFYCTCNGEGECKWCIAVDATLESSPTVTPLKVISGGCENPGPSRAKLKLLHGGDDECQRQFSFAPAAME